MNQAEEIAIERIIGRTANIVDRYKCLAAIKFGESRGYKKEVLAMILEARKGWININTIWQRQWQARTSKRPQRGRHYDSWEIREKYVRCHDGELEWQPKGTHQERHEAWKKAHDHI